MNYLKQTIQLIRGNTMLTIKQALQIKPVFILAVNYEAGSIGEMVGEDRDLNLYLADMTIEYHSLVDNACLSFTTECLVIVNDNIVTIDDMYTGGDNESVYINNIAGLPNGNYYVNYDDNGNSDLRDVLYELIQDQPIYKKPKDFIIEAYY